MMPPGTPPPMASEKVGPGSDTPFDNGDEGSYGVKKDKDGNIILDPGNRTGSMTPIIWVANSDEGTVSKIDTRTMIEVARYYTFTGGGADPSRTTVGLSGDVVVANRSIPDPARASAVRIAGDRSGCVDRNGNGKIDTSENTVAGQAAKPMPWPAGMENNPPDECILWLTKLTPGSLPRAAGYNAGVAENDTVVYIGLYNTKQVVRLDARSGTIQKTINVAPAMPYGLVLDKNGDVWVRGAEGSLAVIRVGMGDQVKVYNGAKAPPCPYGIAADASGKIYTAGSTCISRFDPATETWETLDLAGQGATFTRGLAVDNKNGVWVADTSTGMFHIDASGPKMIYKGKTATLSSNNVGAAVDFDNTPWVISQANSMAYKVNPTNYSTQQVKVGSGPYTYSDMTGYQLRNAGAPAGIWRHTFLGCTGTAQTRWVNLDWKLEAPTGSQVVIRVRSARDKAGLMAAPWTEVSKVPSDKPPVSLNIPSVNGSILQVEFGMKSADAKITPILSGVSAGYNCVFG
jgi:hypothetical protein